ncbi:uncharacterized protein YALI1_E21615g [Yarrowia lipolytica]|uniref:C2H2-type domain-containing protein n=1 Tax=Yarrowia lipolytica TaxID=4952 RepID=A0A1D8NIY0_YARLL|nr:hypothetical protein YALI1_E21615g [Yarrowia lipolytica]
MAPEVNVQHKAASRYIWVTTSLAGGRLVIGRRYQSQPSKPPSVTISHHQSPPVTTSSPHQSPPVTTKSPSVTTSNTTLTTITRVLISTMKSKTRYHCPHFGCKKSYTRRDYVERHAVNREYECEIGIAHEDRSDSRKIRVIQQHAESLGSTLNQFEPANTRHDHKTIHLPGVRPILQSSRPVRTPHGHKVPPKTCGKIPTPRSSLAGAGDHDGTGSRDRSWPRARFWSRSRSRSRPRSRWIRNSPNDFRQRSHVSKRTSGPPNRPQPGLVLCLPTET